ARCRRRGGLRAATVTSRSNRHGRNWRSAGDAATNRRRRGIRRIPARSAERRDRCQRRSIWFLRGILVQPILEIFIAYANTFGAWHGRAVARADALELGRHAGHASPLDSDRRQGPARSRADGQSLV